MTSSTTSYSPYVAWTEPIIRQWCNSDSYFSKATELSKYQILYLNLFLTFSYLFLPFFLLLDPDRDFDLEDFLDNDLEEDLEDLLEDTELTELLLGEVEYFSLALLNCDELKLFPILLGAPLIF